MPIQCIFFLAHFHLDKWTKVPCKHRTLLEFYISKGNYNVSNCQKYKGEKNIPNAKLQTVTETETEWSAQKNMPHFCVVLSLCDTGVALFGETGAK